MTILEEAQKLCYGDRNQSYGHPADDWRRTAKMMTACLEDLLRPGVEIPPERACLLMICVKLSREVNLHKRDNLTDISGYADCVQRIAERMESERIAAETPKRTTDRK